MIGGVVFILGIYFWGRRGRNRHRSSLNADWQEPAPELLDEELTRLDQALTTPDPLPELETRLTAEERPAPPRGSKNLEAKSKSAGRPKGSSPAPASPTASATPEKPAPAEEKIIQIYVVAHDGESIHGTALREAAEAAGFSYGAMRIFHYLDEAHPEQPVFSLANILEPGWFDLDALEEFSTPGVTLFLQLPGPMDGLEAFDRMLGAAESLAHALNAELRDRSRSVLSKQTAEHIREEIREYKRRQRLAGRQH